MEFGELVENIVIGFFIAVVIALTLSYRKGKRIFESKRLTINLDKLFKISEGDFEHIYIQGRYKSFVINKGVNVNMRELLSFTKLRTREMIVLYIKLEPTTDGKFRIEMEHLENRIFLTVLQNLIEEKLKELTLKT